MRWLIVLSLLLTSIAFGDAVIFSGANVKALKQNLDLNGIAQLLSGTANPSITATSANAGSMYMCTAGSTVFVKQDNGSTTHWTPITAFSSPLSATLGGTGQSSNFTQYGTFIAASTSAMEQVGPGTTNYVLMSAGSGGPPSYQQIGLSTTSVTGTLPIVRGGTGVASVTEAPTASSFAGWDANSNMSANNFIDGYTATVTAGSTTTLIAGSAGQQTFTGSSNQTVQMPAVSGLVTGEAWTIANNGTGVLTVISSGGNTITQISPAASATLTCVSTSGTGAASWFVSQGPTYFAATSWAAYTPSILGEGTPTGVSFYWRRVGDNVEITGTFTSGTATGSTASFSLPSGMTSATTMPNSTNNLVGTFATSLSNVTANTSMIADQNATVVHFGFSDTTGGDLSPGNGNVYANGTTFSIQVSIPISGWTTQSPMAPGQSGANIFVSSSVSTDSTAITATSFTTYSNSPGLTFTPTVTGTYLCNSSIPLENSSSSDFVQAQIKNTSGGATLLYNFPTTTFNNAGLGFSTVPVGALYTLTAGTSYQFDLQGKTTSGATNNILVGTKVSFYITCALQAGTIGNGVTSVGTFGSTDNSGGAALSNNILTLEPASGTNPGGVSTTSQTFAGSKTLGASAGDKTTIGSASSTAVHAINGGVQHTTNSKVASYTLDSSTTDYFVDMNVTGGASTVTLPANTAGRIVFVKDTGGTTGSNKITISPPSGAIDGLGSFILDSNYESVGLFGDGTNWYNIAQGETVSMRYHGYSSGGVGVSGSVSTVVYATKDFDTNSAYSSGIYTCPSTGKYRLTAALYPTAATITLATKYTLSVLLNGASYAAKDEWYATAATKPINPMLTTLFVCQAGQTVAVQGTYASSETTPSVTASNVYNFLEIFKESR